MGDVFLSLNFTDGKFFKYSKEAKEGYEEHVSSKGNTSYREYLKQGVTGTLKGLKIRESEFGNEVQVLMNVGEDVYYCSFKIYDTKGFVDNTFTKDLIKVLPNMEIGREYTIFPYRFKPDDAKYFKSGVSVKQNGERVDQSITETFIKSDGTVVAQGDIPALEFKKDVLSGKNMPTAVSMEKRNDALSQFLLQELERIGVKSQNTHVAAKTVEEVKQPEVAKPAPIDNVETKEAVITAGKGLPF
jgi:hypothetical protein